MCAAGALRALRGWAVDFWAGKVTRPHDDVDLAVWQNDRTAIEVALGNDGWFPDVVDDDTTGGAFRRHGVLLELTFVVADERGNMFLPFSAGPALSEDVPSLVELEVAVPRLMPASR